MATADTHDVAKREADLFNTVTPFRIEPKDIVECRANGVLTYRRSPIDEAGCHLSDAELRGMPLSQDEEECAGKLMLPFRVTVTVPNRIPEQLSILAASSCDAVMRAFELLFPDFDSVKPHGGLKVAVEPVRRAA
jgi:hypothetical protein